MNPIVAGFGLFLVSAVCNGTMGLPLRIRRRFEVENTWTLGNLFAMIVFPLIVASVILPNWTSTLGAAGGGMIATIAAFGFGWGIRAVAYSIGVNAVGLGMALQPSWGLSWHWVLRSPCSGRWDEIPEAARVMSLVGIAVAIVGLAVIGRAGALRERTAGGAGGSGSSAKARPGSLEKPPVAVYLIGLGWCIFSGLTSACANLGFDWAEPLGATAVNSGANEIFASLFRWLPLFWGGYLAVLIFSGSKLLTHQTWKNFSGPGAARDAGLAVFLGLCHFGTLFAYGMGAVYLGKLETSAGFAVAMSMGIIVANLLGFFTGEWRTASRASVNTVLSGLAILIISIVILGYGNSLIPG